MYTEYYCVCWDGLRNLFREDGMLNFTVLVVMFWEMQVIGNDTECNSVGSECLESTIWG